MSTVPTPRPATPSATQQPTKGRVSTMGATAIGVGGMMGAGLYTLLGLAAGPAGVWLPVAFLLGAAVSFFSVYSYAKLGARYPSRGGAGEFLVRCFGDGVVAGGLNVFQVLGWIIAMALYAVGFGGYLVEMLPGHLPSWWTKVFGIAVVVLMAAINMVGSSLVSRSEQLVVILELVILALFVGWGVAHFSPKTFTDSLDHTSSSGGGLGTVLIGVVFAAGLLYVTYEGFGVVTNSAGDMARPAKQLPQAMYGALAIVTVVYIVVSTIVVTRLTPDQMEKDAGHVLATAGRDLMGTWGFYALAGAAVLATASAVNATLFGDANLSYMMATKGEIPQDFVRGVWRGGKVGLLLIAGLTMVFVAVFPLSAVGSMASLAFLLIYGGVSLGHIKIRRETGAKLWLLVAAVVLNAALFVLLLGYTISKGEVGTWLTLIIVFVVAFVVEVVYRRITHRKMRAAPIPAPAATPTAPTAG